MVAVDGSGTRRHSPREVYRFDHLAFVGIDLVVTITGIDTKVHLILGKKVFTVHLNYILGIEVQRIRLVCLLHIYDPHQTA